MNDHARPLTLNPSGRSNRLMTSHHENNHAGAVTRLHATCRAHASPGRRADTSRLGLAPQSAGLYALSLGLSKTFSDDCEMLARGRVMCDALYARCQPCQAETHHGPSSASA